MESPLLSLQSGTACLPEPSRSPLSGEVYSIPALVRVMIPMETGVDVVRGRIVVGGVFLL